MILIINGQIKCIATVMMLYKQIVYLLHDQGYAGYDGSTTKSNAVKEV